jgi:hypothetical protein
VTYNSGSVSNAASANRRRRRNTTMPAIAATSSITCGSQISLITAGGVSLMSV